jgi:hypothetical protein
MSDIPDNYRLPEDVVAQLPDNVRKARARIFEMQDQIMAVPGLDDALADYFEAMVEWLLPEMEGK